MTPNQMDVVFCRHLMTLAHKDVKAVAPHVNLKKDAWVWHGGRDNWEFHGPGDFYWFGSAGNAGVVATGFPVRSDVGGAAPFFGGGATSSSANTPGQAGLVFGAGRGGTRNNASSAARVGAAGAGGIIIVDVFV